MNEAERESLIEEAAGAFRPRDRLSGTTRFHPAWYDLDPEGRAAATDHATAQRRIEALLDPEGLSTTAYAVLGRLPRRHSGGA
jgi:hypothetical protein